MKKLISCFLTIFILFSMTTGCNAAGISETAPAADGTRALASAVSSEDAVFTDMPADAEYAAAVAWCDEKGILNGVSGSRFGGRASAEDVNNWVDSLILPLKEDTAVTQLKVSFNGHSYTAALEDNDAVSAFIGLIRERGGSLTVSANDYDGFEKVASLGAGLPANDEQTTTAAGDFVLYNGNRIVLFYGSNSWSYTRRGRVCQDDFCKFSKFKYLSAEKSPNISCLHIS